jgi:hypothetical protein
MTAHALVSLDLFFPGARNVRSLALGYVRLIGSLVTAGSSIGFWSRPGNNKKARDQLVG